MQLLACYLLFKLKKMEVIFLLIIMIFALLIFYNPKSDLIKIKEALKKAEKEDLEFFKNVIDCELKRRGSNKRPNTTYKFSTRDTNSYFENGNKL